MTLPEIETALAEIRARAEHLLLQAEELKKSHEYEKQRKRWEPVAQAIHAQLIEESNADYKEICAGASSEFISDRSRHWLRILRDRTAEARQAFPLIVEANRIDEELHAINLAPVIEGGTRVLRQGRGYGEYDRLWNLYLDATFKRDMEHLASDASKPTTPLYRAEAIQDTLSEETSRA